MEGDPMVRLTVAEKRKKMHAVLNKLVYMIKNTPKLLTKRSYSGSTEGQHCIVGHYLSKEDMAKVAHAKDFKDDIEGIWYYIKTPRIKQLPLAFWEDIQKLNDGEFGNDFWTPKGGLNNRGHEKVQNIRHMIDLPRGYTK
jgi:hypothetical protein